MEGELTGGGNVLFGSETLHAKSPAVMNTWLVKKREDELLEAYYNYMKTPDGRGEKAFTRMILLARIKVFYRLVKPDFLKRKNREGTGFWNKDWDPKENKELEEAIDTIEEYLWNEIKVNAIATRREYDYTNIEEENREKGL